MIVIKPDSLSNQNKLVRNSIKQTKGISMVFNFAKLPFIKKQLTMNNMIMIVEGDYKDLFKDITPEALGKYLDEFGRVIFYIDALNHDTGLLAQLEGYMSKKITVVLAGRDK